MGDAADAFRDAYAGLVDQSSLTRAKNGVGSSTSARGCLMSQTAIGPSHGHSRAARAYPPLRCAACVASSTRPHGDGLPVQAAGWVFHPNSDIQTGLDVSRCLTITSRNSVTRGRFVYQAPT